MFFLSSHRQTHTVLVKVAYHPIYTHPLPEGHRFPMIKYELIPAQLLHEGVLDTGDFFDPEPVGAETLELAHEPTYCRQLLALTLDPAMVRRIGFPLSAQLVERELRIVQGTVQGCHYAMAYGVAFNVAGGTHHAGSNWGEGFCLLNDQAVAAAYLLHHRHCGKILIVDLDVHQGNGTAQIFDKEDRVFTFSMHAEKNFPFRKEQSDLDIGLPEGISDEEYLAILDHELIKLFPKVKPDFVFYQSGVDLLATDKLGKLKLSLSGCRKRDELVFMRCKDYGVPVQVSMGGGYSTHIRDIVAAHCNTFKAAMQFFD